MQRATGNLEADATEITQSAQIGQKVQHLDGADVAQLSIPEGTRRRETRRHVKTSDSASCHARWCDMHLFQALPVEQILDQGGLRGGSDSGVAM